MTITRPRTLAHGVVPAYAAEAVRRRVRARWERRRAATASPTRLTAVGVSERRPGLGIRVVANAGTIERCLARPETAARLFAMIERTEGIER